MIRLAYTSLTRRGSKKVPAGANFVTRGIRCVASDVSGLDRFEVRTIAAVADAGDGR